MWLSNLKESSQELPIMSKSKLNNCQCRKLLYWVKREENMYLEKHWNNLFLNLTYIIVYKKYTYIHVNFFLNLNFFKTELYSVKQNELNQNFKGLNIIFFFFFLHFLHFMVRISITNWQWLFSPFHLQIWMSEDTTFKSWEVFWWCFYFFHHACILQYPP